MADFPYILTIKSIRPFLNHIQGAGVPPKVTNKYLEATGFKSKGARPLIAILKSIGFIDGNGAPTETWKKYRSKTSGGSVLADALKSAYKSLFTTYPDAYNRPNNTIRDFISSHSSAGGRALDAMVGTFKELCAAADFSGGASRKENGHDDDGDDDIEEESDEEQNLNRRTPKHLKRNGTGGVSITVNVQLVVPATDDPAIYDSFFDAMKRHLIQSDE